MTIKELKDSIQNLPDNMEVGGVGHYGEKLECNGTYVTKVASKRIYTPGRTKNSTEMEIILVIEIESAGDEPD